MTENVKELRFDKREYPRIKASCPIRYQADSSDDWQDATLLDYSATGVRMVCEDLMLTGTKLKIKLLPGNLQKVPKISADGIVIRLDFDDEHQFMIACEFLKVVRLDS